MRRPTCADRQVGRSASGAPDDEGAAGTRHVKIGPVVAGDCGSGRGHATPSPTRPRRAAAATARAGACPRRVTCDGIMNRIKAYFEEPEDVPAVDDYYVVLSETGGYVVTAAVAAQMLAQLRRFPRPRWIRFTDHVGSAIHLRTDTVQGLVESTTAQRQGERDFRRARQLEEKADHRPWEDDD